MPFPVNNIIRFYMKTKIKSFSFCWNSFWDEEYLLRMSNLPRIARVLGFFRIYELLSFLNFVLYKSVINYSHSPVSNFILEREYWPQAWSRAVYLEVFLEDIYIIAKSDILLPK